MKGGVERHIPSVMPGIGANATPPYSHLVPATRLPRGNEMEARRTFQGGATSSKQLWIVVAALGAALALGVAILYLAKRMSSARAPATKHVVQCFQAPEALNRKGEIQA